MGKREVGEKTMRIKKCEAGRRKGGKKGSGRRSREEEEYFHTFSL